MTSLVTALSLLLCIQIIRCGFITWAWGQWKRYRRRKDWQKLKEELTDEIFNGHNLSRISVLKQRMHDLEEAGIDWR